MSARLDIGRYAMVRTCNTIVAARVVGNGYMRVETGEHFGELLSEDDYMFIEHIAHEDIANVLASVWGEA